MEIEIIDRWIGKQIKTPRICLFLYDFFSFHFFIIFFQYISIFFYLDHIYSVFLSLGVVFYIFYFARLLGRF